MNPTPFSTRFRQWRGLFLGAAAALGLGSARAEFTQTVNSITITNPTSINVQTCDLIASDEDNAAAGYDRDTINVTSSVQFTETLAGPNQDYELRYQLINESNAVVSLRVGLSSVPHFAISRGNIGASSGPLVDNVRLTPAAGLLPYHQYRARVTLWRRQTGSGAAFVQTTATDDSSFRRFREFNSRTSNDVSYNVRPVVTSVSFTQRWAVVSTADNEGFLVSAAWQAGRYDGFSAALVNDDITLRFTVTLHDALTGDPVGLEQSTFDHVITDMASYGVANPLIAANRNGSKIMKIRPVAVLASASKTYFARVQVAHFATPSAVNPSAANTSDSAATQLMHFSGVVRCGGIAGFFDEMALPGPASGAVLPAGLSVTGLRIANQSGTLTGFAGFTFGDGSPLSVTLEDDGDALLAAGSISVTEPADSFTTLGNLRFEKKNVILTPAGATADLTLLLPAGLGITDDPAVSRIWDSEIVFPQKALTAGGLPAEVFLSVPGNRWVCEESKPIWFQSLQVGWSTAQSRLTFSTTGQAGFVRAAETNQLLADGEVPVEERFKRSNDQVFWKVSGAVGNVTVDADGQGTAKMTAQFNIAGGVLQTHFPYNSVVFFNGGTVKINADAIDTAQSFLTNPNNISVPYAQDCAGEACPASNATANLVFNAPAGQDLRFTRDGGLAATGQLQVAAKLQWGRLEALNKFAHQTSEFTASALHIPGCFLAGAGSVDGKSRPGYLLHSAINQTTDAMVRPGSNAFEEGTGDYAGLNFRASGSPFTGRSVLAGKDTGPYNLSHRCKYVTRRAGVSGIHEAYIDGSFPSGLDLSGYPVLFETFGIQLTQSAVTDSRTKGSLSVQEPAGFDLDFDKMFFSCLGAPGEMELSAGVTNEDKTLVYWQADFRIKNAAFLSMAGAPCDPAMIKLSVSVETWSSEIATALYGTMAFHPNGQIQTGADPATEPAITSRLKLPSNLNMAGPGKERWTATTVGDAYFNHAAAVPAGPGWLNIAAKLNLPFFEDAPVHLHTRARKNDEGALLDLMGGFHSLDTCFKIANETYFTQQPFDVGHRGFPSGVTVAQYRAGFEGDDDRYRMHAQTRWLDVVDLDYPMIWQTGSRTFKDFKETSTNLLILSIKHRCRTLTAENADIDFGAKAGLNNLSLTALASGQVSNLLDTLQGLIDQEVLMNGRKAIEELLEPTMRSLFTVPLDSKMDAQAEAFLAELLSDQYWDAANKQFKPTVDKAFVQGLLNQNGLLGAFQGVAGASDDVLGVLQEVKVRLTQAKAHLTAFRAYSEPGPGNKFDKIAQTATRIAKKVSDKLDDPVYQQDIEAIVAKAKPVLTELDTLAAKAEQVCDTLLGALDNNGPVAVELKKVLTDAVGDLGDAVGGVAGDVNSLLKPFRNGLDDPSHAATRDLLRQKIRDAMKDRFFSTGVSAAVNRILKQRIYDMEQQMRQVVDGVFEQADAAARDVIETVLGGVDKKLTAFLEGASEVMAGAEAKGKAHIRGDSLTDLRLDLMVELKASEKMKAHVFVEIKELNSENTPGGCLPKGGMGTEVTLGAKEVSLEWAYPGLTVSFDTRFQFADKKLTGMGGSIEVLGEIKFGGQFIITEMGCAIMFGNIENYFSAEVAMEVGKGFKAKGGVFFGRTCTLAPFFWDQSIQEALGEAPFTGAYVYGEVHMALNQLIGIPSTCLFNLSVGAGTGIGYFTEGPTWIGKMFLSVEGEVLCIISVTGEISLVGVKNPQGLNLVGKGRLAAELGWCPVCISVEKTATLTYKNKKWSKKVQ